MSIEKLKAFIEDYFVDEEEVYAPPPLFIPDINFEPLDQLFEVMIGTEIIKLLELQKRFNNEVGYTIRKEVGKEFLEKLFMANCPRLLKFNALIQQSYLLYLTSVLFYRYNEQVLKLSKDEFIDKVYFNNLLSLCSRHLPQVRRMFYRVIKIVYKEIEEKSKDVISFYATLYHADETIIKNDIIQLFLISLLPKYNPLEADEIESFYTALFRRIFFFYLKAKVSGISTTCELDPSIIQDSPLTCPSERYRIYEDALYLAQIQTMCADSGTLHRIGKQYDEMKSIIMSNELQKLYLFVMENGRYNTVNQKVALLKVYDHLHRMEHIKNKLPLIYRLLRSMRVVSGTTTFLDRDISSIRKVIYDTLYDKFYSKLADDIVLPVIHNVTENVVKSLTTGEFIDMITLTPINISGQKFSEQLKQFLDIILAGLGTESPDLFQYAKEKS